MGGFRAFTCYFPVRSGPRRQPLYQFPTWEKPSRARRLDLRAFVRGPDLSEDHAAPFTKGPIPKSLIKSDQYSERKVYHG